MSEAWKPKLTSPQERLELILLCLKGDVSVKQLCREAGVSRELLYRWLKSFKEAGVKALEAKASGPKRVTEADASPTEVLKLRERVEHLEKGLKEIRKEKDLWKLRAEVGRRIITRNAWDQPEEKAESKKNGN